MIRLTPEGRRALTRLDVRVEEAQPELLESLSAAERQTLERLLRRVVAL